MEKYMICDNISYLVYDEIKNYEEDVYLMVRIGNQVNALNYSAGLVFKAISEGAKSFDEIVLELKKVFELEEDSQDDIKEILNLFVERGWVNICTV